MATKPGPSVLLRMPNGTDCTVFVSVMQSACLPRQALERWQRLPLHIDGLCFQHLEREGQCRLHGAKLIGQASFGWRMCVPVHDCGQSDARCMQGGQGNARPRGLCEGVCCSRRTC
jgi:hypothetical protein